MSGQFELAEKHIELRKELQSVLSNIEKSDVKSYLSELYSKNLGFLPNAETLYDDYLGLIVFVEEVAKAYPEASISLVDQLSAQELFAKYSDSSFDTSKLYAILCQEPGIAKLEGLKTVIADGNVQGVKSISKDQLDADTFLVFANDENAKTSVYELSKDAVTIVSTEDASFGTSITLNKVEINTPASAIATISDDFERNMTVVRTLIAAVALGVSHDALLTGTRASRAVRNEKNEKLSNVQSVQFTLADMAIELEASRNLTYYSASCIDAGKPSIKFATMSKIQSSEAATLLCTKGLELLGNLGYLANSSFADVMNVSLTTQVKGGTNRVQRNQIYDYLLANKK